ncbi:MAG: hypothetical protein GY765_36080 [bacterium]|nr:hypothetical protein [bacterium]
MKAFKQIGILLILLVFTTAGGWAIEVGVIGGDMSKTPGYFYGISAGSGLLVPKLKMEVELYKMPGTDTVEITNSNGISLGVKFRMKIAKIAPYAVAGVGAEMEKFTLKFGDFAKYTFIGGGIHLYVAGMVSLRGDIRLLNFSDGTKTRFSAGVFLHF